MWFASSTWAGQADLSLETRLGGDSNVFREQKTGQRKLTQDGTFDLSPRVGLHDDDDDLPYAFDYQPTYRKFMTTSGITGVDHIAHGSVGWLASPMDKLEASGSYFNGRQFLFGTQGTGATFGSVNDRERIRISDGKLGYNRVLSPRLSFRMQGGIDDFDVSGTSPNSQTDSRLYSGRISVNYGLDRLTQIGVSASGRLRQNRALRESGRPSSRTETWDVLALISRQVTPTLSVSVQAGPSFITQRQVGPLAQEVGEESTVTAFASASVSKQWKVAELDLSYVRSESRSGTVNSSSAISDEVGIDGNYRLNDHITLRAAGVWSRFVQAAKQQGINSRFEIDAFRVTGTAEFVLSRRIMLFGQYTFANQDNSDANGSSPGGSNNVGVHTGFVALRYTFEPLSY